MERQELGGRGRRAAADGGSREPRGRYDPRSDAQRQDLHPRRGGVRLRRQREGADSGEPLEDGRTLSDYGIQAAATPHLVLRRRGGLQIQVRRRPLTEGRRLLVRSNTFTLDVAAFDSVASVKAQIHAKEGIPPEEQCLVFRGKLLQDERTLQDYCVFKDAELELLGRVPGGMKATGGAPSQPSPAGTPSVVTQASSDRAPRPQVDLEHAAPGPAEATIKEKLARMAVEFRGAIQDARRIAGFEPSGTLEEIDTLLEKLIPELDGSLTPDTTKIAAGAGLDAARKGTRDLLPSDAPTLSAPDGAPPPGRPQRKPSTKVRATADTIFLWFEQFRISLRGKSAI